MNYNAMIYCKVTLDGSINTLEEVVGLTVLQFFSGSGAVISIIMILDPDII